MRKAIILTAVLLSSCAMGPDYEKPVFSMPEKWPWQETAPAQEIKQPQLSQQWWRDFKDPALNALVEEGLKQNSDLLIAASRVAQARAVLTNRQGDLLPTIDMNGGFMRASNSREGRFGGFVTVDKPYNDFTLGAVLNYELDLWGRLRRAKESARADLLASQYTRDAIQLAVVSDIAAGYFNLRALDKQLKIANNTVRSRQDALRYQKAQYDLGGADALTFRQAEAELALAQAQLPVLEQARAEQESALAVLLGRSPRDIVQGRVKTGHMLDDLPVVPFLPKELPSTLMERRPDIAAAEQTLVSANADIGFARASYMPRVSLTSLLGLSSSQANRLLRASARRWNTDVGVTGPLIDFAIGADVDRAIAGKEEALVNYQQTVRVAFKEVMDSLSAQKTAADREKAQAAQTKARNETVRLSQLRYKEGYSNHLEVLDAQRFLYQSQLDRVTARRDRLIAALDLYKALGGGWSQKDK